MAHVAITSDLNGSIYSIKHTGDVYVNRHVKLDGTGPLAHPGLGTKIGTGWSGVSHLAAVRVGNGTCLIGVGSDGSVVAGVPSSTPSPLTGAAFGVRAVFGGTDGTFFTVTSTGALLRQSISMSGDNIAASPPTTLEPSGWGDGLAVFLNGDGLFFDVTLDGQLRYQSVATGAQPKSSAWTPLGPGWSRYHQVFGAGAGNIYAIGSEGTLELRRYAADGSGAVQVHAPTRSGKVGNGMFPWTGLAANIEGYAWPMSYAPGETVNVKVGVRVSTPPVGVAAVVKDPVHYTVQFVRLRRWHNGAEKNYDEAKPSPYDGKTLTASRYEVPSDLLSRGAGWTTSLTLAIPDSWETGVYAAKLTDTSGRSFYTSFIVRPSGTRRPFAVLSNSNTWNAYNSWGGQGKYTHTHPLPTTLPFERPHPGLTPDVFFMTPESEFTPYGPSVVTNSCHLLRAELWILGWLEDLGPNYACDHFTDQDLHDGRTGIGDGKAPAYKAVILNTHPEYWTVGMYDRLRAHRDHGGSIIYLGGNGIYEAVELSADGASMRIFPGVDVAKFPSYISNEQIRLNCLMRSPAFGRPEHALLGVGFQNCVQGDAGGQPYNLQQDPDTTGANPVLDGVTAVMNDAIGTSSNDTKAPWQASPAGGYHADGWEVDQRGAGTPPEGFTNEALIAMGNTNPSNSGEMLCYTTEQGGLVFAASSINFGGSMVVDPNMQRIVQNALDLCLKR